MGMDAFKFPKEGFKAWLISIFNKKSRPFMHYVDHYSRKSFPYLMLKEAGQDTCKTLKKLRRQAGLPRMMVMDNFKGNTTKEPEQYLSYHECDIATTGAESPWQNGICEGKHKIACIIMDRSCVTFKDALISGKIDLEDIMEEAFASMDELPGSSQVEHKSAFEMWYGRAPPGMCSVDEMTPTQLNVTDELIDQVRLYVGLRNESMKVAQASRSDFVVLDAFRRALRPSRGPFRPGDMVFFWSGFNDKGNDKWQGPGDIALIDRAGSAHVKFSGEIYIRCPELLKHRKGQKGIQKEDDMAEEELPQFEEAKKRFMVQKRMCGACRGQHRKHTCGHHGIAMFTLLQGKSLFKEVTSAVEEHRKSRFVFGKRLIYEAGKVSLVKCWDNDIASGLIQRLMYTIYS